MPNWRTITINFPDFASFTDDELVGALLWQDGPWHPNTKAALRRLKATELDMNANWATEHHAWHCPACERPKSEIVRMTKAGVLLAHLEIHHDHMADYFKDELRRRFGEKWSAILSDERHHVAHHGTALLLRFQDTLVCSDCNTVDVLVKGKCPDVDKDFSYSPSEIRRCITVRPNTSHAIDYAAAKTIWQSAAADFANRKEFAATLLAHMEAGWFKRQGGFGRAAGPRYDLTLYQFLPSLVGADDVDFIEGALSHVRSRSISKPVIAQRKKSSRAAPQVPTEAEITLMQDSGNANEKWKEAPADWQCPICERSKVETIRKAKSKKWHAAIYDYVEYVIRPAIEDGDFVAEEELDHHRSFRVCTDCANVFSELQRKRPELQLAKSYLMADEIKSVISAAPHRQHEVDWAKATGFAMANKKWESAIADYWVRFHEAQRFRRWFDEITEKYGTDYHATLRTLATWVQPEYPTWEEHELLDYLRHTLEQTKQWAVTPSAPPR